jgi:hypothetical protein
MSEYPVNTIVADETSVFIKRTSAEGTPWQETYWIGASAYAVPIPDNEIVKCIEAGDLKVLRLGNGNG